MKFLNNPPELSTRTLIMEHRGEELVWMIGTYKTLKVTDNITADINRYWSLLDIDKQDAIFDLYKQLHQAFMTVENTRYLDELVVDLVAKLFEYHTFEDIMKYYKGHARILLPQDLKDKYGPRDVPALTYLRAEYTELIGLSIALKTMIPIWGMYINSVPFDTGSNFKEYRASQLLNKANIVNSSAYLRLANYMTVYWEGDTNTHSSAAIIAGLSAENVPNYLLGNVLFRRVAPAELPQISEDIHKNIPPQPIIIAIYNYIDHLMKSMDKTFGGRITEKRLEAAAGDDDNTSTFENYKIKEDISEGVRATYEVFLTDRYQTVLHRLDPTADINELMKIRQQVEVAYKDNFKPNALSRALVIWVLDPVIAGRIIDYIDYNSFMSAYTITYTLLKHWGYHELALLMFAEQDFENGAMAMQRIQVTEEQLDKLNEIYPHSPNVTVKRKPSRRDSNVAILGIRHVMNELYTTWWKLAEWENPQDYPHLPIQAPNLLPMPSQIEVILADLIIRLKTEIHPNLKQTRFTNNETK